MQKKYSEVAKLFLETTKLGSLSWSTILKTLVILAAIVGLVALTGVL